MNIKDSVVISKDKTKIIVELSQEEFLSGSWLNLVTKSKRTTVNYVASNNILIILDTPKLEVRKRACPSKP